MTNEQKPESAEFRTREAQVLQFGNDLTDLRGGKACMEYSVAERHISEAEARGAAEREAQDIEEAKDEGANYVLTSLALLFGRDGFEIRDGSETWEGDVNATLEGILKAGGLIDEEGNLLDLATLKDRLAEQRRKDSDGVGPVGWCLVTEGGQVVNGIHEEKHQAEAYRHRKASDTLTPLYTRPAQAATPELAEALEACLNYIENTEAEMGITLGSGNKARAALAKAKEGTARSANVAALEARVEELEGAITALFDGQACFENLGFEDPPLRCVVYDDEQVATGKDPISVAVAGAKAIAADLRGENSHE